MLNEFKDSFAWDYTEMLGLEREVVEHRLPIKFEFRPLQQPPRRMSKKVELKVPLEYNLTYLFLIIENRRTTISILNTHKL